MLLFVRLHRDALIQHQATGSVDAPAQNDGVAGHHTAPIAASIVVG